MPMSSLHPGSPPRRHEALPAASVPSGTPRARPSRTGRSTGEIARCLFSPRNSAWTGQICRPGFGPQMPRLPVPNRWLACGPGGLLLPGARRCRTGGRDRQLRGLAGLLDPRDRRGQPAPVRKGASLNCCEDAFEGPGVHRVIRRCGDVPELEGGCHCTISTLLVTSCNCIRCDTKPADGAGGI